jgi:translation initiation factor 2 beta subunit (eIF-2beta)/eIF-5
LSEKLQPRRFVSEYKKRETNKHRNKKNECIWKRTDLMVRVESYLNSHVEYYQFCKKCLGSADDILRLDK